MARRPYRTPSTSASTGASTGSSTARAAGPPRAVSVLHTADLVLNPAARVLWRGAGCVQLELGERRVMIDDVDAAAVRALTRRPLSAAPAPEVRPFAHRALETLLDGGFVWAVKPGAAPLGRPPSPRLAADQAALAARRGRRAGGVLRARAHRQVAVSGTGRAAVLVASVLGAAGVGQVHFTDSGDVHLHQTMPGGLAPDAEGLRFAAAAEEAVRQAAPDVDTGAPPMGSVPDLAVLAVDEPLDSDRRDALHARGMVHLPVRLSASSGIVGPLVIPGVTSCLRCADLHRRDRDPAWDVLAVQLAVPPHRGLPSDVGVATVVAGIAALQALAYLDGEPVATRCGTLELHLPDWRLRRRSWPPHPACGCGA